MLDQCVVRLELIELLRRVCAKLLSELPREGICALVLILGRRGGRLCSTVRRRVDLVDRNLKVVNDRCKAL